MSFNPHAVYSVTIASGVTLSSAMTTPICGNHWQLEIPSMTSGTDIYIKASSDGTTFRRIYHRPTLANSAPTPVLIGSAVSNCMVDLDVLNYPYVKIELSTAMTATSAAFKVVIS